MSFRQLHKKAGLLLLALSLGLLCACSNLDPSRFTTVIYTVAPEQSIPPSAHPSPAAEPTPVPKPVLPPEPVIEPHDYSLPVPEREAVEDDYFSDAVFVGDSRTDGLRLYGGVTGADFICYKGLMCMDFNTKACISYGEEKLTPRQVLEKKEYGKVYIMLGLNELGFNPEAFAADYETLIDQIREVQPNAIIYFQSLVPINNQKARETKQPYYVTNEKIATFNAEVVRLTQEKQALLVDVAEGLTDEEGILPYDAATDGVHFTREWYTKWFAYLKTHTVDPQRLEVTP